MLTPCCVQALQSALSGRDGRPFNRPYAIRLNLAVPHSLVVEAMKRLDEKVFNA